MDQHLARSKDSELIGAIEALTEGLAVFDAEDTMVLCNRQFRTMHAGLEHVLEPGLPWQLFLQEAGQRDLARGLDQLNLHLETSGDGPAFVEAPRPSDRWARIGLSPTPNGGFVLTIADVTEAHAAAELRAEADDLLRQVLDACGVNLMMSRISNDEIIYRNPAWVELFGKPAVAKALYADPAERADLLAELLATGFVQGFDMSFNRADGSVFPGQVTARRIDYGGESVIVSSTADMTRLYAQRDELERQREATFQNEKLTALGELLAGVAHELNNPLSVVVGQALMLREETADTDLLRRVEKISSSAERCAKIVKTFLAMARQKPAKLEPVDLNAIIETAVDVAGYGVRATGGVITLDLADNLPHVRADEDQITQVFVNLLVNADQATKDLGEAARITIRTLANPDGSQIACSVSDNGPGVPASVRARIFEPFFSTKEEGAGVGLALCHRIISGHAGSLSVGSAVTGGARFDVALPIAQSQVESLHPRSETPPSCLKAMIVEDERDVAEILSEMLAVLGVSAEISGSAETAIAKIEDGAQPDIILCDLVMPGMGGEGFLRSLRQRWPSLAKRVAFVTGDSMGANMRDFGHQVLEKPVAPHELRLLLRELIDQGARK